VVDAHQAVLAVSLSDLNKAGTKVTDLFSMVRPVFFTADRDNQGNWSNKKFYEAIACEEFYGSTASWSLLETLKSNGPWYCPKGMSFYQILNMGNSALYLNIETCVKAASDLGQSATCETDIAKVNAYIDGNVAVRTKYIAQYFNLNLYLE